MSPRHEVLDSNCSLSLDYVFNYYRRVVTWIIARITFRVAQYSSNSKVLSQV